MSAEENVPITTESSTDGIVVSLPEPAGIEVDAASFDQLALRETLSGANGGASADDLPTTSTGVVLPPGYRLVTVRIKGQGHSVIEDLPVEVLPCHSFLDLCTAALARVPNAPREYSLQASLVFGRLVIPLEHPHSSVRDTTCSFAASAALLFELDPAGVGARTCRVTRHAPQRQQWRWLRTLARIARNMAKLVLAVEALALLRGGFLLARLAVRGRGLGESSLLGSETEAVMDSVVDFVSGRADVRSLQEYDPRVLRGALEALDTEVLEQLGVPDVTSSRAAVSNLLRQMREEQSAADATDSASPTAVNPTMALRSAAASSDGPAAPPGPAVSAGERLIDFSGSSAEAGGDEFGKEGHIGDRSTRSGLSGARSDGSVAVSGPAGEAPGLPGFGPSSAGRPDGGSRYRY